MAPQTKGTKAQIKNVTRKFPKELIKLLLSEQEIDFEGKTLLEVEESIVDTTRWHTQYDYVFSYDDKFYMFWYQRGSTEYQDEGPEFHTEHGDEILVTEVEAVPVTVIKYKAVVEK
jgi:hypothetical protein